MSDQNEPKPPSPPTPPKAPSPPKPSAGDKQTSASPTVPLKKETVRISLRAKPGTGVPKPRKATAPVPPGGPASKVTAQVPTAPSPPSKSTAKVSTGDAAKPAAPAPAGAKAPGARTVPLAKPGAPKTAPGGPGATKQLPQATVKLNRTQNLAKPGQPSMPLKKSSGSAAAVTDEGGDPEAGLLPISIVGFIVSLALLGVVLLGSNKVNDGEYLEIPEFSKPAWQTQNQDGEWIDRFGRQQLDANPVPVYSR